MAASRTIQTERLLLREPRENDAEALMAVFGDPEAMRYIGTGGPRTIDDVHKSLIKRSALLADRGFTLWTIENHDGEILGDCGVIPAAWTGPDFELAYRLKPSAWGRGYATEAATAAMRDIEERTDIDEVLGLTDLRNKASQRVLAKIGFKGFERTDRYYDETLGLQTWTRGAQ